MVFKDIKHTLLFTLYNIRTACFKPLKRIQAMDK
jgi:hypothetical protein